MTGDHHVHPAPHPRRGDRERGHPPLGGYVADFHLDGIATEAFEHTVDVTTTVGSTPTADGHLERHQFPEQQN
jgi:hypothetical protein